MLYNLGKVYFCLVGANGFPRKADSERKDLLQWAHVIVTRNNQIQEFPLPYTYPCHAGNDTNRSPLIHHKTLNKSFDKRSRNWPLSLRVQVDLKLITMITQWIIVYLKGSIHFVIQTGNYPNKTIFWYILILVSCQVSMIAEICIRHVKICVTELRHKTTLRDSSENQRLLNNYWMRLSMISWIIKAEVCVICRSRRLRQITQTQGFDNSWYHAKTEFNNCFIIHFSHNSSSETEAKRLAILFLRRTP